MSSTSAARKPRLAILGAGPIGLESAAAAVEAGWPFTVYEAGAEVATHVRSWGHVRLFTPWSLDASPRARRLLAALGIETPADADRFPTGNELVEGFLAPLAGHPAIAPNLRLGTRVLAVGRQGLLKHEEIASDARRARPFRLLLSGPGSEETTEAADVVLDTTGTWGNPNSLGDGGIPAPGEDLLGRFVRRDIPDLGREHYEWAGRSILLAGSGHSAQTAARDLAALARAAPGTRIVWVVRQAEPDLGAVASDPLPERAALVATARELLAGASPAFEIRRAAVVESLRPAAGGRIEVTLRNGRPEEPIVVDHVVSLTGGAPDAALYRQLQVHECYAYAAPMKLSAALLAAGGGSADCLDQASHGVEALRSPEPDFFILGAKSYGRNNTFLLRVGFDQVDEVFAALAAEAKR